jgi:membrane associated rhomboid family serine protease
MLWILGSELEMFWGEKFFLKYYLVAGLGAGVFIILLSFINPKSFIIPTIGSSGAVFGLLLAYGITFKNKILYIYGLIPIKAFKLVIILGVIEFLYLISNPNSTISHIAHLGGIITGFIYLKLKKIEKENKLKKYYEWKEKNIN